MVSDMVGQRSFHRHTITSGGRTARPARTAQSDGDRKLPAIPTVQTADTQTAVTVALRESSCIWPVYGAGGSRRCSRVHMSRQRNPARPLQVQLGAEEPVPCSGAVRSRTADNGSVRYRG